MIILATDTSTATGSVAVCDDDGLRCEAVVRYGRAHAERLLDTVDWVLRESGLRLADVDGLAVAIGPGSFTGLRIGVSTWKGLAVGATKPLMGIGTLDAMAHQALPWQGIICPLLDARMKETFGAVYDATGMELQPRSGPSVAPVEDVLRGLQTPLYIMGDGIAAYRSRVDAVVPEGTILDDMALPRAASVAALARIRFLAGDDGDPGAVEPVYLRKSQAEEARAKASA